MNAAVLTTGCRLNQSESDALRRRLRQQGVTLLADPAGADTCFINTCTVTAAADRSSVQLIRRVSRLSPKPRVVVLGCLAERAPESVGRIPGVDEVWTNRRKQEQVAGVCPAPARSRAVLKVQDGCTRRCAYCVVSGLRGTPNSVPAETVRAHCAQLLSEGFHEVVLTGLNLGTYQDGAGTNLAGLVRRLLGLPGRFRVRLGSLEPDTIDRGLLEVMEDPRVCPHLHLPLQTADDRLLAAMGRAHTAADCARVVQQARTVRPDICIGADIIVGLPGEAEAEFRATQQFLAALRPSYLHVFSFSPRPGTRAALTADRPGRDQIRSQVAELRGLSSALRREYEDRFVGTTRSAVVETRSTALTDNFLRLHLPGRAAFLPGHLTDMEIGRAGTGLTGTTAGPGRVHAPASNRATEEAL